MNAIASIVIVLGLVMSPVVMLKTVVMPQLNDLRQFYSTMDQTAQKVADGAGSPTTQTAKTQY